MSDESQQQQLYSETETQEYIKQLREEAKSHRLKAKESQEQVALLTTQVETLRGEKTELEKNLEQLKAHTSQLETQMSIKLALAGRVINLDKAMKLVTDEYFDNGVFNAERFLDDNEFLKKEQKRVVNPTTNGALKSDELSLENKDRNWIAKNWFELIKTG